MAGKIGKKYLSRPYCANHFKGQLPSEDQLKHTKGKCSTVCLSQSILGLSEPESSCACFLRASCSESSLRNSSLPPGKEVILWDRTVVAMTLYGFNLFTSFVPSSAVSELHKGRIMCDPGVRNAAVGTRNIIVMQVSKEWVGKEFKILLL